MEEQLITFETAKLAKEKGFTMFEDNFKSALVDSRNYDVQRYSFYRVIKDEQIINLNVGTNSSNINGLWESYNDENFVVQKNYFAPTQALLQKWLREVHNIHLTITSISQESWQCHITKIGDSLGKNYIEDAYNFEEALENGLQEGLKLISNEL